MALVGGGNFAPSSTNLLWPTNWPLCPPELYCLQSGKNLELGNPGIRQGHGLVAQLPLDSFVAVTEEVFVYLLDNMTGGADIKVLLQGIK